MSALGQNRKKLSSKQWGIGRIELMVALAVLVSLQVMGGPSWASYQSSSKEAMATADIHMIAQAIEQYQRVHNAYPATLAEAGAKTTDPWGRPYQYHRANSGQADQQLFTNKHQVPLNRDFDLYSLGADGVSDATLGAESSHDDIIRANEGLFAGLASEY